jgi:hypothetical protein
VGFSLFFSFFGASAGFQISLNFQGFLYFFICFDGFWRLFGLFTAHFMKIAGGVQFPFLMTPHSNITFNSVHPGSAPTSLGRESLKSLKFKIIAFLWLPMMNTVAAGASSSIKAATSPELEGVTGKYFGLKGEEKTNDKYYLNENEKRIWDYCKKVTTGYL